MILSQLHGQHLPQNGEGITLEDLYQLLKTIPARVRRQNYPTVCGPDPAGKQADIAGISFGQSDQAEKYEFHAAIITTEWI